MSNQIVISSGAKVRNLNGVLTGTAGVVDALGINVPSGIPQLDGSGKILVSQLPNSVMEYKGTWNAATNTPTLVNGTGNQGDVYLCNVAGTVNFGAGPITFAVGDQVIYSGSIWQKAGGSTGTVTSVAVTESGDALTITGSPITTSGTINIGFAGTSGQYVNGAGGLTTFPSLAGYVTAVTGTGPVVSSGGTTPAISMPVATASVDGYLDNADWTTFNNKQNAITLTTTGTSGASTLVGSTLNIPNYSTDLSGYVPYTGATANVDLGTFDLTTDIINLNQLKAIGSGGLNIYSNSGTHIALMGGGGGAGTTFYGGIIGTSISLSSTLTASSLIKTGGTSSQFLKADGSVDSTSYGTGSVTSVGLSSATSGVTIGSTPVTTSGTITLAIATASGSQNGLLSSTDWNTFNGKQNALTNPITGTGTTNYVPKFTASGTIGNSLIYDTGTRVAIGGTITTDGVLTVQSDSGQFCIQSNTTPAKQLQIGYDHISNNSYLTSLQQGVAFTTLALQPNGGNVHVGGSTSNGARLQVTGTATFSGSVTFGSDLFTYANGGIFFSGAATYTSGIFQNANGLNLQSGGSPRLTITSGGNVGISTSSPTVLGTYYTTLELKGKSGGSGNEGGYLLTVDADGSTTGQFGTDGNFVYFGSRSNTDAVITTNNTERMRITSGGNLLINTTTDSASTWKLQVNSLIATLGSDAALVYQNRSDSTKYTLYATGGITYFFNGGNIASINMTTGIYTPLSDVNKKKDFEASTIGLKEVLQLKPTLYRMKTDDTEGNKELGFIAQEVNEFIPQAYVESGEDENKFIGLNYNAIVAALVKSVQEQQAQIEELKTKIK